MQVVVAMIGPYRRLKLAHIANQLNVPAGDVQQLLVGLILDERIQGRIDQVSQLRGHEPSGPMRMGERAGSGETGNSIATQLNVPAGNVQQLLVGLILDERIRGRVYQVLSLSQTRPHYNQKQSH